MQIRYYANDTHHQKKTHPLWIHKSEPFVRTNDIKLCLAVFLLFFKVNNSSVDRRNFNEKFLSKFDHTKPKFPEYLQDTVYNSVNEIKLKSIETSLIQKILGTKGKID